MRRREGKRATVKNIEGRNIGRVKRKKKRKGGDR